MKLVFSTEVETSCCNGKFAATGPKQETRGRKGFGELLEATETLLSSGS
jgi:hypothetical protein